MSTLKEILLLLDVGFKTALRILLSELKLAFFVSTENSVIRKNGKIVEFIKSIIERSFSLITIHNSKLRSNLPKLLLCKHFF
jgi:hypothetical protein